MKRDNFAIAPVEIRHGHLFCGLGGGARGFNKARPRVGNLQARFRCVGGIDVDPAGIRDFFKLSGTAGTVLDMFDLDQYLAFHGNMPRPGWREAGTADIHRAFGNERPHIIFLSAPCKGFSGLLSETKSLTGKYQALNRLTERGVWLALEAFKDDPVELFVFENVPRIATRGRQLLDRITALFRAYGYAVSETTHDCGEIGNLAQSRKRFLLVARHMQKVPNFLYEPVKRPLRAVGDVLGRMPLPGDLRAGPMHRVPSLQWKTWVRLAFVAAGSDWRSLNKLAVEDGQLRDYLVVPEYRGGFLGVRDWARPMGTVAGGSAPTNGAFSVADPRFDQSSKWSDGQAYGVRSWDRPMGAIPGQQNPGQGAYAVADPRHVGPAKHSNEFRIVPWDRNAQAVTSAHGTGQAVADPRRTGESFGKYAVTRFDQAAGTVIGGSTTGQGAFAVADPRRADGKTYGKYAVTDWAGSSGTVIGGDDSGAYAVADPRSGINRGEGDNYLTAGHYGVVPWDRASGAVSAAAGYDNGRWSVADPRNLPNCAISQVQALPAAADKLVCRIQALDGTWHRPFTTLELAALQSLIDPDEMWSPDPKIQAEIDKFEAHDAGVFCLEGESDQAWRERIGNAVPPDAATAIAEVMGTTLLLAWQGETFALSSQPIWVRPVAVALSVGGAA